MSIFNEDNWNMLIESYSRSDIPSRELESNPPSEKEFAKIMLMHPQYNKFIKNEIGKLTASLAKNSKAREGLEEMMKNHSDVKTLEDNTDQKSRVVLPIVVVGGAALIGLGLGSAAAAVVGWIGHKF